MHSVSKLPVEFNPSSQGDGDPGTVQPDASHLTKARALIRKVAIAQIYDGLETLCRQGRPNRDNAELSEAEEQHVQDTLALAVGAMSQLLDAEMQDEQALTVQARLRLIAQIVKEQWETHTSASAIHQAIEDFERLIDDDDLHVRLKDARLAVIRRQPCQS